jgi:hypothetical protein
LILSCLEKTNPLWALHRTVSLNSFTTEIPASRKGTHFLCGQFNERCAFFKRDILGSFSAHPIPFFEFLQSALLAFALTPIHPPIIAASRETMEVSRISTRSLFFARAVTQHSFWVASSATTWLTVTGLYLRLFSQAPGRRKLYFRVTLYHGLSIRTLSICGCLPLTRRACY